MSDPRIVRVLEAQAEDAERIGLFVVRERDEGPRIGLAHVAESIVADEPVTRCGRRLRTRPGSHFAYSAASPIRTCKGCQ